MTEHDLDLEARRLIASGAPGMAFEELRSQGWRTLSERGLVWCVTCDKAARPHRRLDRFGRPVGPGHFTDGHERELV